MNIIKKLFVLVLSGAAWFQKRTKPVKLGIIVVILCMIFLGYQKITKKTSQPQYQTSRVEKGNIIVSIPTSGNVSTSNYATVTTESSGVVKKVYVKNGDSVKSGDPIAEIDLDMIGRQRESQALASYQSSKNSLENAKISLYTLQSTLFTKWKTFTDLAENSTYKNSDGSPNTENRTLPQFISTNDDWLAIEAQYKNQQNVIAQAQASTNSSWLSYQQTSPIIYAPISGTITGMSLQVGSVLTSQTNSSGTSTSQRIASIRTDTTPTITINLTEIDAPKIKAGNKATVTLDAFPGKTFTGQVVSIDSAGSESSGVTTYPAVIKLDTDVSDIFSNMSAETNIITQMKDNILLVPVSAIQTQNDSTYVRILKNGQIQQVPVETGISSDTQTEIVSGISEGDIVVTSITTTSNGTGTQRTQSIFSGGFGGTRSSGTVRIAR